MERLLVYDLGGGTFDVSIVQVERGVVEVLASHGDTHLGGDDFDQLLLDHVCDEFAKEHKVDLRKSLVAKSRVLGAVEAAKKVLSVEAVATIQEEFIAEAGGTALHLDLEIERLEYETLIEPLLAKTLTCVDQSLDDARLNAQQIDKVILVGGASRTPLVHRLLERRLERELHTEVDPDLCVAMGAAVQGGLINGIDVGQVLVDITPHTLGIAALGDLHGMISEHRIRAGHPPQYAPARHALGNVHHRPRSTGRGHDLGLSGRERRRPQQPVHRRIPAGGTFRSRGRQRDPGPLRLGPKRHLESHGRGARHRLAETVDDRERRIAVPAAEPAGRRGAGLAAAGEAVPSPADSVQGESGIAAAAGAADVPADVAAAIAKSGGLISKALGIAAKASEEDRQEIDRLVKDLMDASAARSAPRLKQVEAELEDLVFYLQDA